MSKPTAFFPKLWNSCYILRDDGLSHSDNVDQLTFLLCPTMAEVEWRELEAVASARCKGQKGDVIA